MGWRRLYGGRIVMDQPRRRYTNVTILE